MTKLLRMLLLTLVAVSLQAFAAPPAQQFLAAKTKYNTAGHAKAKGLVMTIEYPTSWAAKEGERPNIVQKFVSEGGRGLEMVLITTKTLPIPPGTKPTEQELKDVLAPSELKEMIPDGATFLDAKATKVEGMPAGILEYSMRGERAGMKIDMRTVSFIFIHASTMVWVSCSVSMPPTTSDALTQRMAEFMPLFTLMANSIVLPDKWK